MQDILACVCLIISEITFELHNEWMVFREFAFNVACTQSCSEQSRPVLLFGDVVVTYY